MSISLSVLLPVYNDPLQLERRVAEVVDLLPEVASAFDVLIIDDGSTDDTTDVACHLATQFPQVRVVRHPVRLGLGESIQTGLDYTAGEIVLVGDPRRGLQADDLRKLWRLREGQETFHARAGLQVIRRRKLGGARPGAHEITPRRLDTTASARLDLSQAGRPHYLTGSRLRVR